MQSIYTHAHNVLYRFEFLKALGKSLVRPNVPHGSTQQWTGERVRQIAGQGDIYIRATYPLNLDGLPDCYGLNDVNDMHSTCVRAHAHTHIHTLHVRNIVCRSLIRRPTGP